MRYTLPTVDSGWQGSTNVANPNGPNRFKRCETDSHADFLPHSFHSPLSLKAQTETNQPYEHHQGEEANEVDAHPRSRTLPDNPCHH